MRQPSSLEITAVVVSLVLIGLALIFVFSQQGCTAGVETIAGRDYQTWTAEECLALLMANTRHNLRTDGTLIYSLVTPMTPDVVRAIGRMRQLKDGVSDSVTYEFIQRLTKDGTGAWLDRQGKLWDARLNPHTGRRDSLMVMINLHNHTFPCAPVTVGGVPLQRLSDIPCETPDITRLDRQIYLLTADGARIYPRTVWGRVGATLTRDEYVLCLFDLRETANQAGLRLRITAFDEINHKTMDYPL